MQIEREIMITAPVERVWSLVTEAHHITTWFAFAGAEIDLRPGGAIVFRWKEHGTFRARIEQVKPPNRLSYRWSLIEGEEPRAGNSTLVSFTLTPEASGTRVHVVESGFNELDVTVEEQAKHVEQNTEGWSGGLAALKEYAEG